MSGQLDDFQPSQNSRPLHSPFLSSVCSLTNRQCKIDILRRRETEREYFFAMGSLYFACGYKIFFPSSYPPHLNRRVSRVVESFVVVVPCFIYSFLHDDDDFACFGFWDAFRFFCLYLRLLSTFFQSQAES